MVLSRQADEWAINLNQQDDWFVPAFRKFSGMLVRGVRIPGDLYRSERF